MRLLFILPLLLTFLPAQRKHEAQPRTRKVVSRLAASSEDALAEIDTLQVGSSIIDYDDDARGLPTAEQMQDALQRAVGKAGAALPGKQPSNSARLIVAYNGFYSYRKFMFINNVTLRLVTTAPLRAGGRPYPVTVWETSRTSWSDKDGEEEAVLDLVRAEAADFLKLWKRSRELRNRDR